MSLTEIYIGWEELDREKFDGDILVLDEFDRDKNC